MRFRNAGNGEVMDYSYPDKGSDWLHISNHDGTEKPCEFAAPYTPSPAAASNGVKPSWSYADGIKFGIWWTGILGGKPTHFKYKE